MLLSSLHAHGATASGRALGARGDTRTQAAALTCSMRYANAVDKLTPTMRTLAAPAAPSSSPERSHTLRALRSDVAHAISTVHLP